MAIGKNVRALRERKGLTFDAVARAVGTDAQAISQMEKRDSKTSNYAVKLAEFFGVDLADLMSEDFDVDRATTRKPPAAPEQPAASLQWVMQDEAELLSLYRACGEAEKATVLTVVRSLPKLLARDRTNEA